MFAKSQKSNCFQARWIGTIVLSSLFMFGCKEHKSVQCEPMFAIAKGVNQSSQSLSSIDDRELPEMKAWLQAARQFSQAGDRLQALKIENRELLQYRDRLARVYRIYALATYDAVRARENKNISALNSARDDAAKAGVMQRQLVREVNAFCLEYE